MVIVPLISIYIHNQKGDNIMELVQSILTNNRCYKSGRTIDVKGIMLHSIGCPQPDALSLVNSWNSESASVCVHAFVDGNNGKVYQTLPWNRRGWHCGSGNNGSGNSTHVSVEMCEPDCITYVGGSTFTCSNLTKAKATAERTYKSAVELFAYICKQYGLNPLADGVIISHEEGHSRGIASNHGDPIHLWNQLGMGYTMDGFRKDVKSCMDSGKVNISSSSNSTPSAPAAPASKPSTPSKNSAFPKLPFNVKVIVDDLNIRKTPSSKDSSNLTGRSTGKGTFEIVELSGSWGKLKSGAGWIYLGNSKYVSIKDTVTSSTASKPQSRPKPTNSSSMFSVGKTYTLASEMKVRIGPGINYRAKKHSELTVDGKRHDVDKDGALDRGTKVTCMSIKTSGKDIWMLTPSGWIAAYYSGKRYIN